MRDPDQISKALHDQSDADLARKRGRHVRPLRGLRGVSSGAIAKVLTDAWSSEGLKLPADGELVHDLFMRSHEDGMVALGLLAAAAPDQPDEALDAAEAMMRLVDDSETADVIGWLILGPALLAMGEPLAESLAAHKDAPHPMARRAAVMAAMAALPEPLEGPAAAALRIRVGQRFVAFVAEPLDEEVGAVATAFFHDQDPAVKKALARLLRTWAEHNPTAALDWLHGLKGGAPRLMREPVEKAAKKALRRAAVAAAAEE